MKKILFVFPIFIIVLLSITISGQTPVATPPPLEDVGDVVKITTTLIQMDVVVTDSKGNQIKDLKPEDFEIYENGKKQDVTNLSYISLKPDNSSANNQNEKGKVGIPVPPGNNLTPEQVRRTYALVIDDLGLSFANIHWVKLALEKFVNEQMQDGDLVGIARTGGGRGAVESFTTDKNKLLASIKRLKWNPVSRLDTFTPFRTTLKEDIQGLVKSDGSMTSVNGTEGEKEFLEEINQARQTSFSVGSLGFLNFLINGMRELPGRKSLMFFSEGFSFLNLPSPGSSKLVANNRIAEDMKLLADTANRSSVVIYTIDPRGLDTPGMKGAADDVAPSISAGDTADGRIQSFRESQQSLQYLAEETGGFAFINQNNINKGMKEAINDQSYYLLGYEPDSETFDPKKNRYNKVEIKVNRPGASVRYRSGFFAIADNRTEKAAQTPAEKLNKAIFSPFGANEIDLRLYTITGNTPQDGDFIRSLVNISAKDLRFSNQPDGKKQATFDIIALTSGIDGKPIDQVMKNYTIQVNEETYQRILDRGFVYDLPISLKKPGAYQFRIALRDSATGKVGSTSKFIEIPKFKDKNLWMSNLLLQSASVESLRKVSTAPKDITTAYTDTTLREFNAPVVLRYGAVIYNAKTDNSGQPKLSMQTRLISNGKVILEGKAQPVSTLNQTDLRRIDLVGAFTVGNDLPPGDYIFQIIVTDELAKEKRQIATQWIDFQLNSK